MRVHETRVAGKVPRLTTGLTGSSLCGTGKVTAMDIDGKVAINFDPLTLNVPTLVR